MTCNTIKWETDTRLFQNGQYLIIGAWKVGYVEYRSRSQGETNNYAAISYLPGLKEILDYYKTQDEAKKRVESASLRWISKLYVEE
jgi:hypothetical protein